MEENEVELMVEKTLNNKIQSVAQHSMRVENLSEAMSESERVILRIKSEQNENEWIKCLVENEKN